MKLAKLIVVTLLLTGLFFNTEGIAQPRMKIKKKEFKIAEGDSFKIAWKAVKKGNRQFFQRKYYTFRNASQYYEEALKYNAENAALNYNLAVAYLFSYPRAKSLQYFEKTLELNPDLAEQTKYYYARSLHLNEKFSEAIVEYQAYLSLLKKKQYKKEEPKIKRYMSQCSFGQELVKQPKRMLIENLDSINTEYAEYSPVLTPEADKLYFTSRRPISKRRNAQDFKYNEAIFVADMKGDEIAGVKLASKKINSKGNDGVLGISPDGQKLYLYKGVRMGDIFVSELNKKGEWKSPARLSDASYKHTSQNSVAINPINNELYFVTDGSAGEGGTDIFMKQSKKNGKSWKKQAETIGDHINTEFDETAVYVTPDGKYLYFSSEGHNSMGGFDIFRCTSKETGGWSDPENMGIPINTPDDDMFLFSHPNGRDAYISSVRPDGKGDKDIYRITFLGEEKDILITNEDQWLADVSETTAEVSIQEEVEIKKTLLTVVKGKILDYNSTEPVAADIEITDNKTNEQVKSVQSKPETGEYVVALESGKNYALTVKADNYMFFSQNFVIADSVKYQEIDLNVKLQPMTEGSKVILKNTFFESGSANLTPESYGELDRLVAIFKMYPDIIIEISGHTDNKGSKAFNLKLSKNRAQSVADYLKSKGVTDAQLIVAGYYFMFPIETNDTEEGRALNRRVEAKIIKVGTKAE